MGHCSCPGHCNSSRKLRSHIAQSNCLCSSKCESEKQKTVLHFKIHFYQHGVKTEMMLKYISSCYMKNSQNEFWDKIKYSQI